MQLIAADSFMPMVKYCLGKNFFILIIKFTLNIFQITSHIIFLWLSLNKLLKKGGDSLSYLPSTTVIREAVNSIYATSLVSHSIVKSKGFIINRFI